MRANKGPLLAVSNELLGSNDGLAMLERKNRCSGMAASKISMDRKVNRTGCKKEQSLKEWYGASRRSEAASKGRRKEEKERTVGQSSRSDDDEKKKELK